MLEHDTWIEWARANPDVDEDDKLTVLRAFISRTARKQVENGYITAPWANKKLFKLGIYDPITSDNTYTLEAVVTGRATAVISAATRAEAVDEFRALDIQKIDTASIVSGPVITDGPEDVDPSAVNPDAPTTVAQTLGMLREIILLANVAGPRFNCDSGANRLLAEYGLAPVPPRKNFQVSRPATVTVVTMVEAYDEESAKRVAGWRWDSEYMGYELKDASEAGQLKAVEQQ